MNSSRGSPGGKKGKTKSEAKPNPKGAGKKFNLEERENVIATVARMSRLGYSQKEIAERTGVSQGQVSGYVKQIEARYLADSQRDANAVAIEREVAVLMDVRRDAVEAYEASKGDAKTYRKEERNSADKLVTVETETTADRLPGAEYLRIIIETSAQIRVLKGLDAPKRVQTTGTMFNMNWDMVQKSLPPGPLPDDVEEAILAGLPLRLDDKGRVEAVPGGQGIDDERGGGEDEDEGEYREE